MRSASDRVPRRLSVPPLALALASLLALAGCSSSGSSGGPAVPSPSGKAAGACRVLHGKLPRQADGADRVELDPASDYTAAWGDPAIELRCGVPRPEVLTPGSEHYNPLADHAEVNGVLWVLEQRDGGYRFTTVDRAAFVEVWVPDDYAPEIQVLTDLAASIRASVPKVRKKETAGS